MGNYRVDYKNGGPTHQSDLTKKSGGASYSAAAVNQGGGSTHQASMSGKSGGPSYDAAITNKSGGATRPVVQTIKSGGASYRADVVKKSGGPTHPAKYKPSVKSFAEVQQIVRAGKAKDVFDIGQELMTHYTYKGTVYDMPWVVWDNNRECEWMDGTKHPGLWIGSKYATIEDCAFYTTPKEVATEQNALAGMNYCGVESDLRTYEMLDLSEGDSIPYNDYKYVYHHSVYNSEFDFLYGVNRYAKGTVRQWLNGTGNQISDWWTPQYPEDSMPKIITASTAQSGFMSGLDADFLAVINPVKVQTAANTIAAGGVTDITYDRFFLPSVEEIYGVPQASGIEGAYFPYWKLVTGLEEPFAELTQHDVFRIPRLNQQSGNGVKIMLRSAEIDNTYYNFIISEYGVFKSDYVINAKYYLPVCVIS